MLNLDQAITEWRGRMRVAGIKNPAVLDELENHLREDWSEGVNLGKSPDQAFDEAIRRIGQASELQREFARADGRESRLRKLVLGTAIVNILLGALHVFGGAAALVSAYNVSRVQIHFPPNEFLFIRLSWFAQWFGAIAGLVAIIAAERLFRRRDSGITLTILFACLLGVEILIDNSLRAWFGGMNGRSAFLSTIFLLYPVILVLLMRDWMALERGGSLKRPG